MTAPATPKIIYCDVYEKCFVLSSKMDGLKMENIENLTQLEAAVDKLLKAVHEMKQEKLVLHARLESMGQEIAKLSEQILLLRGERGQIEQRVNSLLGSIDKWEKLQESSEVSVESGSGVEVKALF
jgi:septal ring factor EnvC (AmiA/AmiB activator)